LRFGLALPQYDFSLPAEGPIRWPSVLGWAQRAEALGFSSVWLSDHLFYDLGRYGGSSGRQRALECFTGLGALSAATSRVRLGTLVACNDFRNPAVLAKMVSTLDVLSGGRVELGLGAGWYEAEYRAAGIPFRSHRTRVGHLSEAVQIVRGMLSQGRLSFDGRHYRLEDARCLPPPGQPRLPVFVGGRGDRIARLAGRHADGFNSVWAWEPEAFAQRVELVNHAAADAGRDPSEVRKTVGLYTLPGRTEREISARWQRYVACGPSGRPEHAFYRRWAQDKLAGTYDQMAERIRRFEEVGVTEMILTFGSLPFQICDPEAVDEFVEEVAPLVI
jgi:probable F420-dependent oxidoreductase